jgi:hypothetical protein
MDRHPSWEAHSNSVGKDMFRLFRAGIETHALHFLMSMVLLCSRRCRKWSLLCTCPWIVTAIPKCFNSGTFSKDFLSACVLRLCRTFCWRDSCVIFQWPELIIGARGSIVGWGIMLQVGRSPARFPLRSLDFCQFTQFFQPHYGPEVNSTSNGNEYQHPSSEVKGWHSYRHLWAECLGNVGASTFHTHVGLHGLWKESFFDTD